MSPAIEYQRKLMRSALAKLTDIESTESLFGEIDPKYTRDQVGKLKNEYAEIMTTLTQHVIQATGTSISVSNEQNLKTAI